MDKQEKIRGILEKLMLQSENDALTPSGLEKLDRAIQQILKLTNPPLDEKEVEKIILPIFEKGNTDRCMECYTSYKEVAKAICSHFGTQPIIYPEKKEYPPTSQQAFNDHPDEWKNEVAYAIYCQGYNKCRDDMKALNKESVEVPSVEEIKTHILHAKSIYMNEETGEWSISNLKDLAQAIHNLITGKEPNNA